MPAGKYAIATFSLADINPQSIKIIENNEPGGPGSGLVDTIFIYTTGSKKTVQVEGNLSSYDEPRMNGWNISVGDKESATRISNALSHAIKLCGGKPDPF